MATDFTLDGKVIGFRFFGGVERGQIVRMDVTRSEWMDMIARTSSQVFRDDDPSPLGTPAEWLAEIAVGRTVEWPTCRDLRQNAKYLRSVGMRTQAQDIEQRVRRMESGAVRQHIGKW